MRTSNYLTCVAPDPRHVALHSGMSGDFMVLETHDWTRVEQFCAGRDNGAGIEELLETLVGRRYLTDDDVDEIAVLRSRYLRGRHTGSLGLTIVTSLGCNFDCPYCFEDKSPGHLKPEVANAIIKLVEDSPDDIPGVRVTWMGGEPLLASRELFALSERLIETCDRRSFAYDAAIITNGWYLDAEMATRLHAHKVRSAQVTIDGPQDIHDEYRPRLNSGSTFHRVIDNVEAAAENMNVAVRININKGNLGRVEELIADLAGRGLSDKIGLGAARMTDLVSNEEAPVVTYSGDCFSSEEFGQVEIEFDRLASRYGFSATRTPGATSTPCTAVRATDVVVGSDGELWKCWDDIGDPSATIGSILDYHVIDEEAVEPWLAYDPFSDPQCSTCVALPGCMGGCAHHLFNSEDPTDRCGAFRANHRERVLIQGQVALGRDIGAAALPLISTCAASATAATTQAVPVTLGPRRGA